MKYKYSIVSTCVLLALFAVSRARAAGTVGTSGATFLEYAIGSRALGMGEAFTAETDDINVLYFNPAGLGSLKYPQLALFHQELILESRLENLTFCSPIKKFGYLGVANTIFWVPTFDKVDINGLDAGDIQFSTGGLTAGC